MPANARVNPPAATDASPGKKPLPAGPVERGVRSQMRTRLPKANLRHANLEHAVRMLCFTRHYLQHVPVFDDLAISVKTEDVHPSPMLVVVAGQCW